MANQAQAVLPKLYLTVLLSLVNKTKKAYGLKGDENRSMTAIPQQNFEYLKVDWRLFVKVPRISKKARILLN